MGSIYAFRKWCNLWTYHVYHYTEAQKFAYVQPWHNMEFKNLSTFCLPIPVSHFQNPHSGILILNSINHTSAKFPSSTCQWAVTCILKLPSWYIYIQGLQNPGTQCLLTVQAHTRETINQSTRQIQRYLNQVFYFILFFTTNFKQTVSCYINIYFAFLGPSCAGKRDRWLLGEKVSSWSSMSTSAQVNTY